MGKMKLLISGNIIQKICIIICIFFVILVSIVLISHYTFNVFTVIGVLDRIEHEQSFTFYQMTTDFYKFRYTGNMDHWDSFKKNLNI